MSYEVFARKYRPQTFDDLVGHAHVSRTLKNAVAQNRLAHAYLFVGPRGIGKTSTARILAKSLNCVKGPTVTPCGVCDACREITSGNSFGVFEYDAASNTQVDKIRELIVERVKIAPTRGYKYKIYIIDEVHMLSPSSFNALLKTLEEPPPHVIFIFATTEVNKLPLTIVSRCQRFDLHRIPANLIGQHLQFISGKEKITLEPAAAHAIARGAEGGLRDAESMLDQLVAFCGEKISENDVLNVFGFTSEQTVIDLMRHILRAETPEAIDLLHQQSENGKDMMRLMSDLIAYLRDLLVFKAKPDALKEDVDPAVQKSLGVHAELIAMDRLLELIDQFAAAEGRMKWAPNKKLHFEVALIKAIQSLGQATLDEVIEKLGELRDGKTRSPAFAKATADKPDTPSAAPVTAGADRGHEKSRPKNAGVTAPGYNKIAEAAAAGDADPNELWQKVLAKIPAKGLLRTLGESVRPIGIDGRNFLLGHSPDDRSKIEVLASVNNRRQLEALLNETTGRDWSVKFVAKDGILSRAAADAAKPAESFKDDPLIQEAIELFSAQIKS
ncbi:MAG TPA: DNA polymerase III subunit gamma/tau [Candidatus Udaeobacter sp.]|nr:DNA polymerase III subunit gamma/tau [Candidatus Udaeobacter sp.]